MNIDKITYNMPVFTASFSSDRRTQNILRDLANENPTAVYQAIKTLENIDSNDIITLKAEYSGKGKLRHITDLSVVNTDRVEAIDIIKDYKSDSKKYYIAGLYNTVFYSPLSALISVFSANTKDSKNEAAQIGYRVLFGYKSYKNPEESDLKKYIKDLEIESGAVEHIENANSLRRQNKILEDKIYKNNVRMISEIKDSERIQKEYVLSLIG